MMTTETGSEMTTETGSVEVDDGAEAKTASRAAKWREATRSLSSGYHLFDSPRDE